MTSNITPRPGASLPKSSVVAYIAVASIISGMGGLLKLPSPVGSVALDAVPGLFSSVYYLPWVGGIVGAIGHLLSAASGGFPSGAIHLLIAVCVGIVCTIFGLIARAIDRAWGLVPAALVAIILNNAIPFVSVGLGLLPLEAALSLVFPFLLIAASVNVGIACFILLAIRSIKAPNA